MNNNSLLSMKISLKMLRDARNKDFKGCLDSEINVGLNIIEHSPDFEIGV